MSKQSIVFFGSGSVAANSLQKLQSDFQIESIVTKPSTEKEMSLCIPDTPVFTASNRSELDQIFTNHEFKSEVAILIDFGIIVSNNIIRSFSRGILNSHFSILPELRGADPITFAILSGQKTTGVSVMQIVEAMDEGDLLGFRELTIAEDETEPTLTDKLISMSDGLLKRLVPEYLDGTLTPQPQSITGRETSYSRKLTKQDGILDFTKSAEQLEREIRAFIKWPKSRTNIAGKDVVILKASVDKSASNIPGVISETDDKKISIGTKSGTLIVEELKPAGKTAMSASAFLAGNRTKL